MGRLLFDIGFFESVSKGALSGGRVKIRIEHHVDDDGLNWPYIVSASVPRINDGYATAITAMSFISWKRAEQALIRKVRKYYKLPKPIRVDL